VRGPGARGRFCALPGTHPYCTEEWSLCQ
jgi:hypothetical protein